MAGARTEKREVLPFEGAGGFLTVVKYRHSTNTKFQDIHENPKSIVIPVDDLRSIPRHEISLVLDQDQLPNTYKKEQKNLALVVLTRDAMLKREFVLYQAPINGLPESFVLDPVRLKATSCRTELPLELNICAISPGKSSAWPKRRASRLFTWNLNLANHGKGPKFPWVRKTAEDFKKAGLPPSASYLVVLNAADPSDLLTDADAEVEELLEVWVHEDVWVVLQQSDANEAVAGLQRAFVAQIATQVLGLAVEPLRKKVELVSDSVCYRLMDYIATHAKVSRDDLVHLLRDKLGATDVAPYVFSVFGVNKAMSRVLER